MSYDEESHESILRRALEQNPAVKRAQTKRLLRLPFWVGQWTDGIESDGRQYKAVIIARSRGQRRDGITVKVYYDELIKCVTEKDHQELYGTRMAQALIDLGLGWYVKKHKLPAKEPNHGAQEPAR